MLHTRLIPCLLLRNGGLVKTQKFKDPKYVGDPINAVRIFNDKEVDELVFLDITATSAGSGPNFSLLADIASEAFMPFGYGGGITSVEQVRRLFALGVEKAIINTAAVSNLIREGETPQIPSMIQTGAEFGMKTMAQSLKELAAAGVVAHAGTAHRRFNNIGAAGGVGPPPHPGRREQVHRLRQGWGRRVGRRRARRPLGQGQLAPRRRRCHGP